MVAELGIDLTRVEFLELFFEALSVFSLAYEVRPKVEDFIKEDFTGIENWALNSASLFVPPILALFRCLLWCEKTWVLFFVVEGLNPWMTLRLENVCESLYWFEGDKSLLEVGPIRVSSSRFFSLMVYIRCWVCDSGYSLMIISLLANWWLVMVFDFGDTLLLGEPDIIV